MARRPKTNRIKTTKALEKKVEKTATRRSTRKRKRTITTNNDDNNNNNNPNTNTNDIIIECNHSSSNKSTTRRRRRIIEQQQKVLKKRKTTIKSFTRDDRDMTIEESKNCEYYNKIQTITTKEIENILPFCCSYCCCSIERTKWIPKHDPYIFPSDDHLPHRRCCHGLYISKKQNYNNNTTTTTSTTTTTNETTTNEEMKNNDNSINDSTNTTNNNNNNTIDTDDFIYTNDIEIQGWVCPYHETQLDSIVNPQHGINPPNRVLEWVTTKEIKKLYNKYKSLESQLYNIDDSMPHPLDILHTHDDYRPTIEIPFQKLCSRKKHPKFNGIVILNCFAGVGTAIVTLKKLQIPISKIIHVEHDKIATHVYKYHHDNPNNNNNNNHTKVQKRQQQQNEQNDNDDDDSHNDDDNNDNDEGNMMIQHVYIETFEELYMSYETICEKHGPIDLIIGAPPCTDFIRSSNIYHRQREDDNDKDEEKDEEQKRIKTNYMIELGSLIRTIERYQRNHPLFFLVETSTTTTCTKSCISNYDGGNKKRTTKQRKNKKNNERNNSTTTSDILRDAFGLDWDPIWFDAQYVSPIRRSRYYMTNIPLFYNRKNNNNFNFMRPESYIGPESCLETNFILPVHLADPQTVAKADISWSSPFLSSIKNYISNERNTLRMYIFHNRPKKIQKQQQQQQQQRKGSVMIGRHNNTEEEEDDDDDNDNNEEIHYYGRPINILEREQLLGFPKGYIEIPVMKLFLDLKEHGLSHLRQSDCEYDPQIPWKQSLPKQLHHFAGNYHKLSGKEPYRFYVQKIIKTSTTTTTHKNDASANNNNNANNNDNNTEVPKADVFIKMSPPCTCPPSTLPSLSLLSSSKQRQAPPSHFTSEQYCKYLLGMAYSIPVLEHLLQPLKELYGTRIYKKFQYKYEWSGTTGNDDSKYNDSIVNEEENEQEEEYNSDEDGLFADTENDNEVESMTQQPNQSNRNTNVNTLLSSPCRQPLQPLPTPQTRIIQKNAANENIQEENIMARKKHTNSYSDDNSLQNSHTVVEEKQQDQEYMNDDDGLVADEDDSDEEGESMKNTTKHSNSSSTELHQLRTTVHNNENNRKNNNHDERQSQSTVTNPRPIISKNRRPSRWGPKVTRRNDNNNETDGQDSVKPPDVPSSSTVASVQSSDVCAVKQEPTKGSSPKDTINMKSDESCVVVKTEQTNGSLQHDTTNIKKDESCVFVKTEQTNESSQNDTTNIKKDESCVFVKTEQTNESSQNDTTNMNSDLSNAVQARPPDEFKVKIEPTNGSSQNDTTNTNKDESNQLSERSSDISST